MTSPEVSPPPYGSADPQPYGSAAPRPASSRLAIVAFVLALAAVVLSSAVYVAQMTFMVADMSAVQVWTVINAISNIGSSVVAVAALIVGLFALRGTRRALAGAAVGISAVHVATGILALLVSLASYARF